MLDGIGLYLSIMASFWGSIIALIFYYIGKGQFDLLAWKNLSPVVLPIICIILADLNAKVESRRRVEALRNLNNEENNK